MKPSKVYFTDMRVHGENLPDKLIALARAAGIENIDFADKYVAIKVHFGEVGNLAFLRPDYARALVRLIRELVELRRGSHALQSGEVVKVDNSTPKQVLSYLRRTPEESLLVAVNLSAAPAETEFSVPGVKERATLPPGGWIVQSL